ncbi:MAG: hypothetical protein Q8Q18_02040 [bacterium]|nr:hypothetical protein [bacterium]
MARTPTRFSLEITAEALIGDGIKSLNQQPRRKRTGYDGMHGLNARV